MSELSDRIVRIVALGGGTGMHALLSGLKRRNADLCAIITVADDGGSSGRLRRDFDIPPPGDIRNCLVALSDAEPLVGQLFQFRFEDSMLKGHAFGNLFIAVLTKISGDFRGAIERARSLLSVRGKVIPSTDRKVVLVAEHSDGTKSTGEQAISHAAKTISRISLVPKPPPISQEIQDHIAEADLICLGPGSLYTSIAPNLLVPGMIEAISASRARVIYVGNLMTQPGETDGFDLASHVKALQNLGPRLRIDDVLVHSDPIEGELLSRYAQQGSIPVGLDGNCESTLGTRLVKAQLLAPGEHVRHDPELLSTAIWNLVARRVSNP